jgi:hypothetical protein
METLRFPFVRNRFQHNLLERVGNVCLVERINKSTGGVHWEVVVLHHWPARTWPDGRRTSGGERYPRLSWWGKSGWTYTALCDARERFGALVGKGSSWARVSRTASQPVEGDGVPLDAV